MSLLDDDLASIFTDTALSVSVTFGAPAVQRTRGLLSTTDVPEPDRDGGIVLVSRRTLTIQESALTGLASGRSITADGVAYTIHGKPRSSGRGKLQIILAG